MQSQGTHVSNGMVVDGVAGHPAFTVVGEVQGGSPSTRWTQVNMLEITSPLASGWTITCTPYASATSVSAVCDIFRGLTGVVSGAFVGSSNASAASAAAPALAAAPDAGDLVLAGITSPTGGAVVTAPAGYTTGSLATTPPTEEEYVLSASGASAYGGSYSLTTAQTSASFIVAMELDRSFVYVQLESGTGSVLLEDGTLLGVE